ncbi:MAG: hypothetical protein ACI4ST_03235 [Candidatus Gallimonas sp.]
MTAKKFFKSTAFKSVSVLLAIVLIAGALLAILNDVLYVTPAERRNRVFAKIYGGNVTEREVLLGENDDPISYPSGTVSQAYFMSDGSYAVQATGKGGFSGGSITVWVIFSCAGDRENGNLALEGIEKVVYESNVNQSYINRFTSENYNVFTLHDGELKEGLYFGDDIEVIKTGASAPFTFAALTNAVNASLRYFREELAGEIEENPYEYADYINLNSSSWTTGENKVEYALTVKGNSPAREFIIDITVEDGRITAYEIVTNGSTTDSYTDRMPESVKDGTLFLGKNKAEILALLTDGGALSEASGIVTTGATRSTESCVRAAAFAAANFERILSEADDE